MSKRKADQDDLVAVGFKRLDAKLLEDRAPKIQWGVLYKRKSDKEKIRYLEKLAASMNHAAALIQEERNQLVRLCELKEQQLAVMAKAVEANNAMLQQEIVRMNAEQQGANATIARLNTRVKELEG